MTSMTNGMATEPLIFSSFQSPRFKHWAGEYWSRPGRERSDIIAYLTLLAPSCFSACILIASKLEDRSTPKMEDLCYISDHSFSESRLRELEEDVCKHLSFRLSSVSPLHFINEFLRASHACPSRCCQFDHAVLRNVVLYILALSRLSYDLSLTKPSLLAAASVYLARATLGMREADTAKRSHVENPFWTKTLEHYTGYSLGQLKPVILLLHKYQTNAESTQDHKGIFATFRPTSRKNASLKTAVPVESLCLSNVRSSRVDIKAISAELF